MNVLGAQFPDPARYVPLRPQTNSSMADEMFSDKTNPASNPTGPDGLSSVNPQQADTVTIGSVSLDLSFARSESLSTSASVKDSSGYASIRQDLSRSFQSELNIDFSFASTASGVAEKLSNLDPSIFAEWQKTASDLLSLNTQDYNNFINATDGMFNEIEKALGLGSTGLDYVADFFKNKVGGFLNDVNRQMDYFNNNPLGSGPDMGLNIPGLFDSAKKAIPGDLAKYLEQRIKDPQNVGPESELLKRLKEIYKQLMEEVAQPATGGPDPFSPQPPQNADMAQTTAQSNPDSQRPDETDDSSKLDRVEEFSIRHSSYMRKSVSNSILLSYAQQAVPAEDKSANKLALTA